MRSFQSVKKPCPDKGEKQFQIGKKSILAVMSALLLVFCTGCERSGAGPSESMSSETNSGGNSSIANSSTNSSAKSITDNVIVEYDPVSAVPQKCKVYNASIKSIEPDLMNELLFGGAGKKTDDPDSEKITFEAGNKHGYAAPNSFFFYTDNGTVFDDAVTHFSENPNEAYMDSTSELSFASRDTVIGKTLDFIDGLGLDPQKAIIKNMYSVKKEDFDLYKDHLSKVAAEENDERASSRAEMVSGIVSEDFYFIDLAFKEDEIPIYSGSPYSYGADDNDTFCGTKFSLVYTKNGIEFVSAFYLYQKDNVISDSEIIDFSDAQRLLKNKYDNMFVENKITFYDAELIYLPFPQNSLSERFKNFIMRPYYAFYGTQSTEIDGESYPSELIVFFDAVTGKEL